MANLRARAHVLCGRAHARRGELAAAAHVLRSALHASKNADRPSGAVAADAHAALADVAAWIRVFHIHTGSFGKSPAQVAACAVSRRRGDVSLQWIDSEAEEFAATCESRRHHANGTTADAKADAEWTPDVRAKASVTVRPTCSGSPGAARDPAATAAASHLERAEAASEVVYGRVTGDFAAALVLAARGALAAATGDDKAACDTFARAEGVLELQVPPHLAQPRMCDLLAFSVVIHLVGTRQRGVFRPRQFFTMDARLRRRR